jgi:hypothetical protein
VREEYGKLGLLAFEHGKDSTLEPEIEAPVEFLELIDRLRGAGERKAS